MMKINFKILCVIFALSTAYFAINRSASEEAEDTVLDNIFSRSSVRAYEDKPIDGAILEKLVKAGMAAPTAGNVQPWEFIIVTDKAKLAEYANINQYAAMAPSAAAGILVVIDQDSYKEKPHMSGYGAQDAAAASQNILLAANAMGIGSVWTGIYSENKDFARERMTRTSELLNLAPNETPFGFILLGYPEGKTVSKDKWKPEKVQWMK